MANPEQNIEPSYDIVLGDKKLVNIIGNKKVKIEFPDPFKLGEEDEKEFGQKIRRDRAYEYKNLLDRIDLHCDLSEFDKASNLVEEANAIYHNYHILLSYNALCIYALSDISKLTIDDKVTNRIVKLLKTAKEQRSDSKYYLQISSIIGENFYDFINESIQKILKDVTQNWIRQTPERQKLYYNAIARHLIQLETCFEIHQNTKYLEDCINHLSGQKKYAWINLNGKNQEEDFGRFYFAGGTRYKILELKEKILEYDKSYQEPELLFGNYFEVPVSKKEALSTKRKRFYLDIFIITLGVFALLVPILLKYNIWDYFTFLAGFGFMAWIFHPRGQFRMSYMEQFSRFIYKKMFSLIK